MFIHEFIKHVLHSDVYKKYRKQNKKKKKNILAEKHPKIVTSWGAYFTHRDKRCMRTVLPVWIR